MCEKDRAFSVQYHPESAPGPQDSAYLFDRFIDLMQAARESSELQEAYGPESDKEVPHA